MRVEQSAEHRVQTHHFEIRTVDDPGADFSWLAEPDHREADRGEVAELGQRLYARL